MRSSLSFAVGVILELVLLLMAFGWTVISGEPVFRRFAWSFNGAAAGILAALPLLVVFVWTIKSKLPIFARHRTLLDGVILRLFAGWTIWQLAAVSICAGVCEEALFRGAIQSSLTGHIGPAGALIVVAVLFGAAHPLSWTYGAIAGLMGAYLGLLFLLSGNLLVPMVTHAVYDFLALVYFLGMRGKAE